MTSANRMSLSVVRESTLGTTPGTPRMRKMRITGESLTTAPEFVDSDEIRDDRMQTDPIQIMQSGGGSVNFELSFPEDETPLSEAYRSAFMSTWTNAAVRANDGTADSVITALTGTTDVATVLTGTSFVAGQLVRFSGNANSANNGVFKVTTGGATSVTVLGAGLVTDAAPAAASRIKVVGAQGASGDITATSGGLGSTALDFTTLGLAVGQWIKIGGTGAGNQFATAVLNGFARITAITATTLTLDNKPVGWTTDAGTGKTIKIWFGDQIKNGLTLSPVTIERGFLGQAAPTYIINNGMCVNTMQQNVVKGKLNGVLNYMGMGVLQSQTSLDASPDAVTTNAIMAAGAHVGRLGVNGGQMVSPNWVREFNFTINNNLRQIEAVDSIAPVSIREGEFTVTGRLVTYFGDNTELAAFYAGSPRMITCQVARNGQALIWTIPRATYRGDGNPNATGKNTDVMLPFDFQASIDTTTNSHMYCDRLEYYEA